MLGVVAQNSQITVREIAAHLGITERTVMRIIADLESAGYLHKSREARANTYEVHHDQPLRRAQHEEIEVGELLRLLASEGEDVGPDESAGAPDPDE